jgi:sigma-54 dependent transcriptional regulator, acetoin dehydrogenase operon transcriptional activator AcoR
VFAELGGAAAMAAADAESLCGIVTVTDSGGRILASWGDRKTLGLAEESNLAPWFAWPEWSTGTNGMGTALECRQPVIVQGAEHWCQGFHAWSCAGVAIRDAATDKAIAVLNVSLRGSAVPGGLASWLRQNAATMQAGLRKRERQSGIELVAAFARAAAGARGPVAALDMAGRVVIANHDAGLLLGVPSRTPAADPASRWVSQVPELAGLARHAGRQAHCDPHWRGSTRVYIPFTQAPLQVSVTPVFQARQMIGLLLTSGSADGDPIPADPPAQRELTEAEQEASALAGRVIARRDDRLVVLTLPEIRYAESDGNTVWLATDQGRLRANTHGLDNLERELEGHGFLRVHRQFLVNLHRIREIDHGFKGSLFLITDVRSHETVPVSRRHAPVLRQALGI